MRAFSLGRREIGDRLFGPLTNGSELSAKLLELVGCVAGGHASS